MSVPPLEGLHKDDRKKPWKWWKEASMYPTVITHRAEKQQGGKQRREEKSIEYDKLTNVTILMKLRFELGFWMRNPRMTLDDMEFMRKDGASTFKSEQKSTFFTKIPINNTYCVALWKSF